jgi:hypothetical protein
MGEGYSGGAKLRPSGTDWILGRNRQQLQELSVLKNLQSWLHQGVVPFG